MRAHGITAAQLAVLLLEAEPQVAVVVGDAVIDVVLGLGVVLAHLGPLILDKVVKYE